MVKFKRQIFKLYSGQIEWQISVAKSKQLKICIKILWQKNPLGGGGGVYSQYMADAKTTQS